MKTATQALLAVFCLLSHSVFARSVPAMTAPVVQEQSVLPHDFVYQMNAALHGLYKETGIQIGVLLVQTLDGDDLNDFSIRVTDQWQLGKKGDDKGLLVLLALKEKKIRIEVGRGLEGDVPDAIAKRVIEQTMIPLLKQHHLQEALLLGIAQIVQRVDPKFDFGGYFNGSYEGSTPNRKLTPAEKVVFFIIFALFVFLLITHPQLLLLMLFTSGRGGGFGSGGRDGGGWSGGGGGFSGGGASGGW